MNPTTISTAIEWYNPYIYALLYPNWLSGLCYYMPMKYRIPISNRTITIKKTGQNNKPNIETDDEDDEDDELFDDLFLFYDIQY